MSNYVVIGHGAAADWSDDASSVERDDADLLAAARAAGLYEAAHREGYATRGGELLDDGWLCVVDADEEELDRDPAVIAYCSAS